MLDFEKEEVQLLIADGFSAGFMMDIREGDLVAIPPVTRSAWDGSPKLVKTLTVQRVFTKDVSYEDEDRGFVRQYVVNFIGVDLDGLPEHCAYGATYPCFIKKP